MVSAASSTIAIELANFLEQPAQTMEDKDIRGSGDRAEVRYQTLTHENVIVCGRAGITKEILWARDIKSDGLVCLAAEVRLTVHFCQMQNITVAVAAHDSGLQLDSYQQGQLQDLIHHADVRFLAGEFVGDLELLLGGMRQSFTVNLAAWEVWEVTPAVAGKAESYICRPLYIFVVGPVKSVKTLPIRNDSPSNMGRSAETNKDFNFPQGLQWAKLKKQFSPAIPVVTGNDERDDTRGWAPLPLVKQKQNLKQQQHTTKLSIFCEGSKKRRAPDKEDARHRKAMDRYYRAPTATLEPTGTTPVATPW